MTAPAIQPASVHLPAIDQPRAALQSALIEALNRRVAGESLLTARVAGDERPGAWIVFDAVAESELRIAPLLADGALLPLTDPVGRPDAAAAAVALGAVEPIVAAVELVVGEVLHPVRVVSFDAGGTVCLVVETHRGGIPIHRILLAIDPGARIAPTAVLPLEEAARLELAPAWKATIAGPTLPGARLREIAPGDLLLLGTSGNVARFTPPGRTAALLARLDVRRGAMNVIENTDASARVLAEATPSRAPGSALPGDYSSEIRVPTSVEFDGGGLTLDRIATLGVGSVVAVPAAANGVLPVRLLAGTTQVATGELVAVGDGYGVLITAVTARGGWNDAASEPPAPDGYLADEERAETGPAATQQAATQPVGA